MYLESTYLRSNVVFFFLKVVPTYNNHITWQFWEDFEIAFHVWKHDISVYNSSLDQ